MTLRGDNLNVEGDHKEIYGNYVTVVGDYNIIHGDRGTTTKSTAVALPCVVKEM